MNRKIVCAIAMILCITGLLSACGGYESGNNSQPAGDSRLSAQSDAVKLVFHDTIDDLQAEYLNSLGGGVSQTTGTVKLDLILYETESNVFEGYGIMTRSLDIRSEESSSKQEYLYRTGLMTARAGQEGSLTLTGGLTEDRNTETMAPDAPFHLIMHKDGTLQQKDLPFLLQLEGKRASLSIRLHDHAEFNFSGELTQEAAEAPVGKPSQPGALIYINSLWSGTLSGGGDGDYTAILLASPGADQNSYTGQLSIHGNGTLIESFDETVTFSLDTFRDELYQKAGGELKDKFAQMGVLHVGGGTYLLLLDGNQVILEPAGKGIFFCGKLRSQTEAAALQNEAGKTRKLLADLCRQNSLSSNAAPDYSALKGLDPNNPEDMEKLQEISGQMSGEMTKGEAPAWYPGELIPVVNFSRDDGYSTIPSEEQLFFKIYNTGYCEEEDFEDLVAPYRAVLSGYDDFKEYIDNENAEGVFLFTMGKYLVQVHLSQHVIKSTNVTVQIY